MKVWELPDFTTTATQTRRAGHEYRGPIMQAARAYHARRCVGALQRPRRGDLSASGTTVTMRSAAATCSRAADLPTQSVSPATGPSAASFTAWNTMVGNSEHPGSADGLGFPGPFDIPHTPFTVFGEFEQFLPNTRVAKNPLDFQRYDRACSGTSTSICAWRSTHRPSCTTTASSRSPNELCPGKKRRQSVRGAARHPRILPAHGVQILATMGGRRAVCKVLAPAVLSRSLSLANWQADRLRLNQ